MPDQRSLPAALLTLEGIYSCMNNIYVDHTDHTGKGIFAGIRFRRGKTLFTLEGEIVVDSYGPNYWVGARWIGIGDMTWLSPSRKSHGYYINHSCDPNAVLKDKIIVVAMRDIRKGEEITLDYSLTEADPDWRMRCKCGSRDCRKVIRSIQFLPEEHYRKYEPYVPEFLRKARLGV
jgi:hypothetical protein